MRDRRLHVLIGHMVPEELIAVVDGDIRQDAIETIYDELVRVTALILKGQCMDPIGRIVPRMRKVPARCRRMDDQFTAVRKVEEPVVRGGEVVAIEGT